MKIFIIILQLVLALTVRAYAFILPEDYKTGAEVCAEHSSDRQGEFFKWINVPVDYSDLSKGQTAIYAYTKKVFNPDLPTVIFFTGGPGVSSRSTEFSLPETNVLFFEQRGISCSRPATKELFLNPDFYSSENTAKDALAVVRAWTISKVSVYGHSYGTIPATVFASLFPSVTRTLILEGVVYHADETLWLTKTRDQLLQSVFDSLSPELQAKILDLSSGHSVPASWFSQIGKMMLYLNNGTSAYKTFLEGILSSNEMDLPSFINNFFTDPNKPEENFSFGDITMGMIGCREMSMSNPLMSLTTVFENGKLVSDHNNVDREALCKPLKLENAYLKAKPFKAEMYPVKVPVSYLLGETDGATPLEQGLAHFQNVAKGIKTAFIMKNGGHLPSLGLLKDNRDCKDEECDSLKQNILQTVMFEKLVRAESLDRSLIEQFNNAGELQWNVHQ